MSALAMVGGLTVLLPRAALERLILPLVSFAAGTLLGGALFHMIPEGVASLTPLRGMTWLAGGFAGFLALEQFLHWHHTHRAGSDGESDLEPAAPHDTRKPVTYLILAGDAVHNFLGGVGIASTFLLDPRAGMMAFLAAAAHEVPQELGDFGVLVHGGWPRGRALLWNFISALTFPAGGVVAYLAARQLDVSVIAGLVLLGAGNFIYIAASDLIPEIKAQPALRPAAECFAVFAAGLGLMLALAHWHPA